MDCTQALDLNIDEEPLEQEKRESYELPSFEFDYEMIGRITTIEHKYFPKTEFSLYTGENNIGRDGRCEIHIQVQGISKRHACINYSGGGCVIYDMDSRNKTRKGKMILKPHVHYDLVDGTCLTFGDLSCNVTIFEDKDDETGSITNSDLDTDPLPKPEDDRGEQKNNDEKFHKFSRTPSPSLIPKSEDDNAEENKEEEGGEGSKKVRTTMEIDIDEGSGDKLNQQNEENNRKKVEDESSSLASSDIILPTQNYTEEGRERVLSSQDSFNEEISTLNKKATEDAYAMETDSGTDDDDEIVGKNDSLTDVVLQTPGFGLQRKTIKLSRFISESDTSVLNESTVATSSKVPPGTTPSSTVTSVARKPVDEVNSPEPKLELFLTSSCTQSSTKDKLSSSFNDELADDECFADTLPVANRESQNTYGSRAVDIKKLVELKKEQYADTLPVDRTHYTDHTKDDEGKADQVEDSDDDEGSFGTYVFDTAGFDGREGENELQEETENDDEETQKGHKEENITPKTDNVNKGYSDDETDTEGEQETGRKEMEASQEIPIHTKNTGNRNDKKKIYSFGTPTSSINASEAYMSAGEKSSERKVAIDSQEEEEEEEATQAYNINSPVYGHQNTQKIEFNQLYPSVSPKSLPGRAVGRDDVKVGSNKGNREIKPPTSKNKHFDESKEINEETQVHFRDVDTATQAYTVCDFGEPTQAYVIEEGEETERDSSEKVTELIVLTQAYTEDGFGEATQVYDVDPDQENELTDGIVESGDKDAKTVQKLIDTGDDSTRNKNERQPAECIEFDEELYLNATTQAYTGSDFGEGTQAYAIEEDECTKKYRFEKDSEIAIHQIYTEDSFGEATKVHAIEMADEIAENTSSEKNAVPIQKPKIAVVDSLNNKGKSEDVQDDNSQEHENGQRKRYSSRRSRRTTSEAVYNKKDLLPIETKSKRGRRTPKAELNKQIDQEYTCNSTSKEGIEKSNSQQKKRILSDDTSNCQSTHQIKDVSQKQGSKSAHKNAQEDSEIGQTSKQPEMGKNIKKIVLLDDYFTKNRKRSIEKSANNETIFPKTDSDSKNEKNSKESTKSSLRQKGRRGKKKAVETSEVNDGNDKTTDETSIDESLNQPKKTRGGRKGKVTTETGDEVNVVSAKQNEYSPTVIHTKIRRGKRRITAETTREHDENMNDYSEEKTRKQNPTEAKNRRGRNKTALQKEFTKRENIIENSEGIISPKGAQPMRRKSRKREAPSPMESDPTPLKDKAARKNADRQLNTNKNSENRETTTQSPAVAKVRRGWKRTTISQVEILMKDCYDKTENSTSNQPSPSNKPKGKQNKTLTASTITPPECQSIVDIQKERTTQDNNGNNKRMKSRRASLVHKPSIIFTGISDKSIEKLVTDLGGTVVDNVEKATHLVTDKVRRTVKFMCGLARGIPVVSPDWLQNSKTFGIFTDYKQHILKDETAEKLYKFLLKGSLQKANEAKLLDNIEIHVTKNVKPEPKNFKAMVESSGGKYVGKLRKNSSKETVIISCEDDREEYESYLEQEYTVCSNELLLTGILRQELDIEQFSLAPKCGGQEAAIKRPKRRKR